jgi:hypothetical protein
MIGNHRIGLLGQALLLLGVVPMPPPREPELDMVAVEKAMRDLIGAGLEPVDVHAAAGSPRRFVETAQKCLSMQAALAAQGRPSVDVPYLLAQHDELVRGSLPTRPALHGFEGLSNAREGMPALPRPYPAPTPTPAKPQPSPEERQAAERNRRETLELRRDLRPQQAAARKARGAKKARRGW